MYLEWISKMKKAENLQTAEERTWASKLRGKLGGLVNRENRLGIVWEVFPHSGCHSQSITVGEYHCPTLEEKGGKLFTQLKPVRLCSQASRPPGLLFYWKLKTSMFLTLLNQHWELWQPSLLLLPPAPPPPAHHGSIYAHTPLWAASAGLVTPAKICIMADYHLPHLLPDYPTLKPKIKYAPIKSSVILC